MNQYKEFQGKTLDDAIKDACDYYGVAREKLEIEIVSDAKTGIFGLVGAKKASIRAARVQLPADPVSSLLEEDEKPSTARPQSDERAKPAGKRRSSGQQEKETAPKSGKEVPTGSSPHAGPRRQTDKTVEKKGFVAGMRLAAESGLLPEAPSAKLDESSQGRTKPSGRDKQKMSGRNRSAAAGRGRNEQGGREEAEELLVSPQQGRLNAAADATAMDALTDDAVLDAAREDMPDFDLESCDQERVFAVVREVIQQLVLPIVGSVPCEVSVNGKRIRATLDCGDASGLLVGRDGQTLAAVQYLAARIVARMLGGAIRLQIDAGKYRERQDDRLKDLALALAAKARETGRPQSTRPLSAYQRRIVHLALESDSAVLTRSKGDGAQRRVVIYPKRDGGRVCGDSLTETANASRPQSGEPACQPTASTGAGAPPANDISHEDAAPPAQ